MTFMENQNISDYSSAVIADLAPTGKLRAAINFGNYLLTAKDPVTGKPRGIAVDLVRELGKRLDVTVEIVGFDSPGALADAVKAGVWDVGLIGAEPQRANEITFTPAYLEIEATYLVPAGSPLRAIADVDRKGVRIAVLARSAYELYLNRSLQHAELVLEQGFDSTFQRFVTDKLDALAGLRPQLAVDAGKLTGSRILDGRFTAVQQAIGIPKARLAGARYLREFVEDAKATGFIARIIETNGIRGVSVASAASRQT
jgi:polar amino acid transport system substrate-binding protein